MGYLLLNILLAAIPSILIVLFIYRLDRNKKETPLFVFMAFVIGFFAVIPALVIEVLLAELGVHFTGTAYRLFRAFVVAAVVEEGTKLAAVRLFLFKSKFFNGVREGILYTVAASLGFAFFENVLYSFGPPLLIITRGITAVPLHASASGILGYFIGTTKVTGKNRLLAGLLWAVIIHGLYDYLLFTRTMAALLVFPLLLVSILVLVALYKKGRSLDLDRGERAN